MIMSPIPHCVSPQVYRIIAKIPFGPSNQEAAGASSTKIDSLNTRSKQCKHVLTHSLLQLTLLHHFELTIKLTRFQEHISEERIQVFHK